MRAALVTVLLMMGCSKQAETKQEPAGTPAHKAENTQTPEDKAGDLAAQAPAPSPADSPAVPTTAIDCAALVTAEDVAKACGGAKVDIAANANEGKNPALGACWRTLKARGKQFPLANVMVNAFGDATGAEGWVKLDKTAETKPLAGLGDAAWTRVSEIKDARSTEHDVGVRKGHLVLKLTSMQNSLNKNPPCNLDQLTELAKIIVARWP